MLKGAELEAHVIGDVATWCRGRNEGGVIEPKLGGWDEMGLLLIASWDNFLGHKGTLG